LNKKDMRYLYAALVLFGLALNAHGGIAGGSLVMLFLAGYWLLKLGQLNISRIIPLALCGAIGFR